MSISFAYDSATDVVTLEGVRYAAKVFHVMGNAPVEPGRWFKIIERKSGVLTILSAAPGSRLIEPTEANGE